MDQIDSRNKHEQIEAGRSTSGSTVSKRAMAIACGTIVIGSSLVELLYLSSEPDFVGGNLYPGMCFLPTCMLSLPLFAIWQYSYFKTTDNRSPELEPTGEKEALEEKDFLWAFGGMIGFYLANLLNLILLSSSGWSGGYRVLFIVTGGILIGVMIGTLVDRAKNRRNAL